MIRILGVLLALAGLIVVGMSDNKRSAPKGGRLMIGLVMMLVGVIVALAATQIALLMGWTKP